MAQVDLPRASDLPRWMQALRDRYLTTETGQFIVHGNVHDLVLAGGRVWEMSEFLGAFFAPSGKLVVHYDPGRGVWFPRPEDAARAALPLVEAGLIEAGSVGRGTGRTPGESLSRELELVRDPVVVLPHLEALLVRPKLPCAVIIHYAELIAPDGTAGGLGFHDRTAAATLHRWSQWGQIVGGDNAVVLLTSALPALARRLSRNPRVGVLKVPLPGPIDRARFLVRISPELDPDRGEQLTRATAGLQLRQIQDIMSGAPPARKPPADAPDSTRALFHGPRALPLDAIAARKKEILEQECFGLIEVVEPNHDLSAVGGLAPVKAALRRVIDHVRTGRRALVPMGILFVGPMGTGKTFVAEAFAKESGLAALTLKNFRDKWVGSTEANLEKVLEVIEALGEILVIIDEGDRSIGGGAGEGDGGVNARVIARLKEFMSDPRHRGRVIFVMMTNRPDRLDTDMKRPGRFDLKIPFFSPRTAEARAEIVRAVIKRHALAADLPDDVLGPILANLEGYAAADLEALVLLAEEDRQSGVRPEGVEEDAPGLTGPYLEHAARDFLPTREIAMIEYMELLAVHEASNRRMLPEPYAKLTVDEINARLRAARAKALSRQNA